MFKVIRFAPLVLAAILVLVGCSSTNTGAVSSSKATEGGVVTRAMTAEPAVIDPQDTAGSGLNLVLPYLFDTLVFRAKDGTFEPFLAEKWDVSPDGKSITFNLRKGVKFHDGSPLNAEAVAFTFKRFKATGTRSPIYTGIQDIADVEVVDDLTVRFRFDRPSATFWTTVSMPYAAIMSPSAVQAAGSDFGRKPVGTGPFKLEQWSPGASITLVRNPDYNWGPPAVKNKGPVRIDKLVFKLIPDATTQLAALQAGEVDVIFINDPGQLAQMKNDQTVQISIETLDSLIYLGFNSAKAPFDDVPVRQALSYAVNKEEIIKTALGGLGKEAATPLPPTVLGYNADLKQFGQGYDPAKAKALLAEAGFAPAADGSWARDGKKLPGMLVTSTRAPNDAIATVIQSQMKAIGVPVEIQQLDSAAVMKATTEGKFDLLLWRYDWNDPDALNIYLSSSRIRQTNRVFYGNKEVDALLERGRAELDPKVRIKTYYDAQKIILSEAPWQPLYIPVEGLAYRNRLQGVVIGALGRMLLNDVTVEGNK